MFYGSSWALLLVNFRYFPQVRLWREYGRRVIPRVISRAPGERMVVVVICQTPSGYRYLLAPVSQDGAAAPLTLGLRCTTASR